MKQLEPWQLEQLRRTGTCVVASTIETFGVRLQNTGFTTAGVKCIFPDLPPIAGYAATARIRSAQPPMEGRSYYRRTDWWNHILSIPAPRVVVVEDVDDQPGLGAFVGEVNSQILMALGCIALVTNGAVRDLDRVQASDFQMFAGNISVSHAYAHVFDFGGSVKIGGLEVRPGQLLHGDRHGILSVPIEIAAQVPAAALEIDRKRQRLVGLCRMPGVTAEDLRRAIDEIDGAEMPAGISSSHRKKK